MITTMRITIITVAIISVENFCTGNVNHALACLVASIWGYLILRNLEGK